MSILCILDIYDINERMTLNLKINAFLKDNINIYKSRQQYWATSLKLFTAVKETEHFVKNVKKCKKAKITFYC